MSRARVEQERRVRSLVVKIIFGVTLVSGLVASWPLQELGQAQGLPIPLLQTIDQRWDELSPRERSRALENYQRFQKLPQEKQRNIEERYNRWRQLPSEEQDRLRRNYERYRGMNSDQKEEFLQKYKKWRSSPRK
jgi:hypothetical protein